VPARLPVCDAVGGSEDDLLGVGGAVPAGVPLEEPVAAGVLEAEPELVLDAEPVRVAVCVAALDVDGVCEAGTLRVPVPVPVKLEEAEDDPEEDAERVAVPDGVGVPVPDAEADEDADPVGDCVRVMLLV
jgi:hypothetical protein